MTDAEIHDRWIERAGIREHEGGQSVGQAEFNARADVRGLFGRIPKSVTDAVKAAKRARQNENDKGAAK